MLAVIALAYRFWSKNWEHLYKTEVESHAMTAELAEHRLRCIATAVAPKIRLELNGEPIEPLADADDIPALEAIDSEWPDVITKKVDA